jgi:hypothetical protein
MFFVEREFEARGNKAGSILHFKACVEDACAPSYFSWLDLLPSLAVVPALLEGCDGGEESLVKKLEIIFC